MVENQQGDLLSNEICLIRIFIFPEWYKTKEAALGQPLLQKTNSKKLFHRDANNLIVHTI